jgi:hypothetical protein
VSKDIVYEIPGFDNPRTFANFICVSSYEDGFVTVYDSILVYSVSYDDFSFDYKIIYQVPVYDDGVTKQVMPYYRYENIRNGETRVSDGESRVVEGKVYAVKNLRHSIDVDFNGEMYTVKANITLLRKIGDVGQPYLTKSEIVGQSITPLGRRGDVASQGSSWRRCMQRLYIGQCCDCAISMSVYRRRFVETLHATSPSRLGGCRKCRRGDVQKGCFRKMPGRECSQNFDLFQPTAGGVFAKLRCVPVMSFSFFVCTPVSGHDNPFILHTFP